LNLAEMIAQQRDVPCAPAAAAPSA
jgi:hypothetical protein